MIQVVVVEETIEDSHVSVATSSCGLQPHHLSPVSDFTQIQTTTKKVEVVVEDINATAEGLMANITKEPQYVIKKSLQFKSGMNVLGM